MPTYTYQCDHCGAKLDIFQKFTDDPLTHCPECAQEALQRVYRPVGVVFKGSGFYATDNRSASGRPVSSKPAEKAAGESSSASSSDAPASATPAASSAASDSGSSA